MSLAGKEDVRRRQWAIHLMGSCREILTGTERDSEVDVDVTAQVAAIRIALVGGSGNGHQVGELYKERESFRLVDATRG